MLNLLLGLIVPSLGYLLQVRPRFYNRYFGVDTWRNLSIIDYIRKNSRLPESLPKYMLKGPFDYPPLLCVLLSGFSKKFLERSQGFIVPIFDALINLIVFLTAYIFTQNALIAIIAQLIYLANPLNAIENASLTSRSLGTLFFTAAFLTAIFYSIIPALSLFILAVFFTTLMLFSQKMASQVMFFIGIIFSIIERNFAYFGIYAVSVLLAMTVSRGFYLRILFGQLAVLKYFRLIIKNRYAHQVRGVTHSQGKKDFIEQLKEIIKNQPLLAMVLSSPLIAVSFIMALDIIFHRRSIFLDSPSILSLLYYKFALWVVILYILGIITAQVKIFQFLGEGMKYLMYAGMPAAVILAAIFFNAFNHGVWWIIFVILSMAIVAYLQIIFLQNKAIINDSLRSVTPSLWRVMDFLENTQPEVRLATLPFSLSDTVAYFTKSNILSSDSAFVLANNPDYLDFYPVLRRPLEEILRKHNINYLLLDRNYVGLEELKLEKVNIVLEDGNLCLIKR